MTDDWRSIDTAPRDGTPIEVRCDEEGPFEMYWDRAGFNPLVSSEYGIWMSAGRHFTWCEDSGFGPTHWRPLGSNPGTN